MEGLDDNVGAEVSPNDGLADADGCCDVLGISETVGANVSPTDGLDEADGC